MIKISLWALKELLASHKGCFIRERQAGTCSSAVLQVNIRSRSSSRLSWALEQSRMVFLLNGESERVASVWYFARIYSYTTTADQVKAGGSKGIENVLAKRTSYVFNNNSEATSVFECIREVKWKCATTTRRKRATHRERGEAYHLVYI